MIPIDIIFQDAIHVLSSPAWTGFGVIISSTLAGLALRRPKEPHPIPVRRALQKKISFFSTDDPLSY